jgi:hypothetical protein
VILKNKHKCPHCEEWILIKDRWDMLREEDYYNDISELWQCDECDGYFRVIANITRIDPLVFKVE